MNRGSTYVRLKRYEDGLADLTHAIQLDPIDAQSHTNRGMTYSFLQRYDEALADLTRAIEFDPNIVKTYTIRGRIYVQLKRYDEAMADFKFANQLNPMDAEAYFYMGALLASRGALQEALPNFEKAAQLGHPEGVQLAAQVRQDLGIESLSQVNPTQLAFDVYLEASSPEEIRRAVEEFPFMINPDFIAAIEEFITQQVPPEDKPEFEQRLSWLRQIASTKK